MVPGTLPQLVINQLTVTTMKFNLKQSKKLFNHEGAPAYGMSPELELYTAVVTASLNDKFYETNDECMSRIIRLISQVSPKFVAQLAVYARTQMYLRSIPLLLVVELARIHNGDDLVARTIDKVVLRADEITELLACYQLRNPSSHPTKKLSHLSRQVQNGLQRAFNRFDEYQFAKYNRKDAEVKLRDALFLVHPKPKDAQQQMLFDKIAHDTLDTPTPGKPSCRFWVKSTLRATRPGNWRSPASGRNL